MIKHRLLTGDTPTGKLHLGHWVGSLQERVALQEQYESFFLIANAHAFTTQHTDPAAIRASVIDIVLDYLAAGIDPERSAIVLQSEIPAITDLCFFFSMLVPYARLMRNPTLKHEIQDKGLGDSYSFGFLLYPVGQIADILAFRPTIVPVGEDQVPHLEMAREVARRFNQLYCNVSTHVSDSDHLDAGGIFPIFATHLSNNPRLVGITGPTPDGRLCKMSKSLNNAIFLSDSPEVIAKKVNSMYTDPRRIKLTDPGVVEDNPLWIFHDIFNPDLAWVADAKERYRQGAIGDVECKRRLTEVLIELIAPIYQRRLDYARNLDYVIKVLREGTERANQIANTTLALVKRQIQQQFW